MTILSEIKLLNKNLKRKLVRLPLGIHLGRYFSIAHLFVMPH